MKLLSVACLRKHASDFGFTLLVNDRLGNLTGHKPILLVKDGAVACEFSTFEAVQDFLLFVILHAAKKTRATLEYYERLAQRFDASNDDRELSAEVEALITWDSNAHVASMRKIMRSAA